LCFRGDKRNRLAAQVFRSLDDISTDGTPLGIRGLLHSQAPIVRSDLVADGIALGHIPGRKLSGLEGNDPIIAIGDYLAAQKPQHLLRVKGNDVVDPRGEKPRYPSDLRLPKRSHFHSNSS
jgi:hypothetical protein